MKGTIFSVLAMSVLLLVSLANPNTATAAQGKVVGGKISEHPDWFKESFLDIAEDVDEATESGKHVILFMHLNGCPYCYKMTEENFKNAPYTDYIKEHFDVIAINIKGDTEVAFNEETTVTEKELANLLKVRYTPTIIFLNPENKPVARLNGYRSVSAFEQVLHYVQEKAYTEASLEKYIAENTRNKNYRLRDHAQLQKISDLKAVASEPLAVIFEDTGCDACDTLHDGHLKNPEINAVLKNFTVVRLDAHSSDRIIDPEGNETTPKAFAEKLGLTYRPGIVLFDKGREISRIDGMLYTYHFQEMLRYVGERHYEKYPDNFYDYLGVRTDELLKTGANIDLSK